MSRALTLFLLVLLAPTAAAQMSVIARPEPGPMFPGGGGAISVSMQVETQNRDRGLVGGPWLLAAHDNLVNVTIFNALETAWNGSFRVNVTGATGTPDTLSFDVPGRSQRHQLFTVHPDDMGRVEVAIEGIDAFYPGGEPIVVSFAAPALLAPEVRFVDPPVAGAAGDDDFQLVDMFGGMRSEGIAYVRLRPGETLRPRLEVRNDLAVATSPFTLSLSGSREPSTVDVRSLAPGESITVELPEFLPIEAPPMGGRYFGPMGRLELYAIGEFALAQVTSNIQLASYEVDRGAVTKVVPTTAVVDVQDGLSIEFLVPRDPRLGVPTRVRVNLTNLGTQETVGTLVVTIQTPNNLFYGVQGPESKSIPVRLGPGEADAETFDFTPRVTGQWGVNTIFRSAEGFGYGGGGGGFTVEGPVRIRFDRTFTEYARIGEPVQLDLVVETDKPLQDATLEVTTGTAYYSMEASTTGGEYRPGLVHRLLEVDTSANDLGTLRPGGALNASLQITGRSSGRYAIVPYVLSEGFAYTSRPFDPQKDPAMDDFMAYMGTMYVAVQPRAVPAPLALLPLTVGLAVFVGTWTLRTRFVK